MSEEISGTARSGAGNLVRSAPGVSQCGEIVKIVPINVYLPLTSMGRIVADEAGVPEIFKSENLDEDCREEIEVDYVASTRTTVLQTLRGVGYGQRAVGHPRHTSELNRP